MKKFILISIALLCFIISNAQEITVSQVAPLFKKSFNQLADFISSYNYSYIEEEKNDKYATTFIYSRTETNGHYELTTTFKKNKLHIFSYQKFLPLFNNLIIDLRSNGYKLIKSFPELSANEAPRPVPSSVYKYINRKLKITCMIVCPYNIANGTMLFSVNYTNSID